MNKAKSTSLHFIRKRFKKLLGTKLKTATEILVLPKFNLTSSVHFKFNHMSSQVLESHNMSVHTQSGQRRFGHGEKFPDTDDTYYWHLCLQDKDFACWRYVKIVKF